MSFVARLFGLLFLINSISADDADLLSEPFMEAIVRSVHEMNPTVQNITVVGKEKGCHEVSYELTNSMHLTPECLQRASFPAAATATTPVLAFKYSRTLVGMGHSVEGQLNVAKEIATQNGWQWLELWTDDASSQLPDFDVFVIRPLTTKTRWRRRESESDAIVVHCSTSTCFERLKSALSEWKGLNSWIFTEDVTKRLLLQNNPKTLFPLGVHLFGMTRSFSHNATIHEWLVNSFSKEILPTAMHLHDGLLLLSYLIEMNASDLTLQAIRNQAQKLDGLTAGGPIRFDSYLKGRTYDQYNIFSLSDTLNKAGVYNGGKLVMFSGKDPLKTYSRKRRDFVECQPVAPVNGSYHFRVVTIEEPPFLFYNKNSTPRYTGFLVDMMELLKKNMDATGFPFTYTFGLSPDGTYGDFHTTRRGVAEPGGLLGEIVHCRADLAVAPIMITANRQKHVDFTKPWMDSGLMLMSSKPHPITATYFAFLDPLSPRLWILAIVFIFVASLTLPLLQMITPSRLQETRDLHENRHGCFHYFRYKLYESVWFFFTTAMQQGSEGATFLPAKILIGIWYFFVMILVATYTANLAAFLTFQRIPNGISSIDDLAAQVQVPYGTVKGSAVESFFANSPIDTYHTMGMFMMNTPSAMVDNSSEGIRRAGAGILPTGEDYVFIWDAPTLQYLTTKRPCSTRVLGRSFNRHGYGIVMPKVFGRLVRCGRVR
ncbi:glutamate receptor ionotropic, kainate 3-like isoform X3 [Oscarella lobularis]|uniref:glutamate receptor ionotropic, kainate 3-like isoform X3 n=1 Tax=Oscarella lobularis TaxID=121494 RepID=UPI00331331D8